MFLTDWLFEIFDSLDSWQVLLLVAFLFMIDAMLIPVLPEVFFVLGFHNNPTIVFGSELLLAAVIGELAGVIVLYYAVKHIKVPRRLANAMNKYIDFLIVSDEKVLLVNRVAPMLPATGAFMAIMEKKWDLNKCFLYLVAGCLIKYGFIMVLCQFAYDYIGGTAGQDITIIAVIVIIVISAIASYVKRKDSNLK